MTTISDSPTPNNPGDIDGELLWGESFERMLADDEARRLAEAWPVDSFPRAAELPRCPFCGETVEQYPAGVLRCADCRRSFWSRADLESYRDESAAEAGL